MGETEQHNAMSDQRMTALFRRAIEAENERAMALGYPVERMDESRRPYLLYPDGHRKYYDSGRDLFFAVYPDGTREYNDESHGAGIPLSLCQTVPAGNGSVPAGSRRPEVLVFAGPNGSGKSTITGWARISGRYINADDIKRTDEISDLSAAQMAEEQREKCLSERRDFTFETVLSTPRNIGLLRRAKEAGFLVRSVFVLTESPDINILRVQCRVEKGGHSVPRDRIISRHPKSLRMLSALVGLSDICHVFDNSGDSRSLSLIFSKRDGLCRSYANDLWDRERISSLTGIPADQLRQDSMSEA